MYTYFGIKEEGVKYRQRVGAYGVAIKGDSVLIEKARLGYFLPGGGVEDRETIEEALEREFLEETGYELIGKEYIGSAIEYVCLGDNRNAKKVGHFYAVECGVKTEPSYPDGHMYPVEWISLKDIKEKMPLCSQWWAIEQTISR